MTTAAAMCALATTSSRGQVAGHPKLGGVWVLDASKNIVDGQLGAPSAATSTIVEHGDTITIDREVSTSATGTIKGHTVWAVDGKPWKNTVPVNGESTEVASVLSWEKDTLVIHTTLTVQGTDVDQLDRWTVDADGQTLVMRRSVSAGGQEFGSTTLTYVKRP